MYLCSLSNSIGNVAVGALNTGDYFEESKSANIDSKYYECDSLKDSDLYNKQFVYRALHLNVQSLPSKHDDLKVFLANFQEAGISFDFILLCETFLTHNNFQLFSIPGYKLLQKKVHAMDQEGVLLYISKMVLILSSGTICQFFVKGNLSPFSLKF